MTDPTPNSEPIELRWLDALATSHARLKRAGGLVSGDKLAAEVAADLKVSVGRVGGWINGLCELAAYAAQPVGEGDAVGEEDRCVAVARSVSLPVFESRLQARIDAVEATWTGPESCEHCDQTVSCVGWRSKVLATSLGPVEIRRRYLLCKRCGQGNFPAERAVGLGSGKWSPRLAESLTMLSTTVPHEMAVKLAGDMLGIDVSVHGLERLVARRAAFVSIAAGSEASRLRPHDDDGRPRRLKRPADAVAKAPDIAYIEADGVFSMARFEDCERSVPAEPGARGGKGRRYDIVGCEIKNGILYTGDDVAAESSGRGCLLDKTYVSQLGSWRTFAERMWPELLRKRFDQAGICVVLGDGADWLDLFCAWLPFKVLRILDLYHVKKRINEVAHALYPDDELSRHRWRALQYARVDDGDIDSLLQGLADAEPRGKTTRELVEALVGYVTNHRNCMDYPRYRAMGLRVGSGAVESANYHVTGNRLKLQGMRWTELGAADMALLRADLHNNRWRARTMQMLAA